MTKKKNFLIILCIIGLSALVFSQCVGKSGNGGNSAATGQENSGAANNGNDSTEGGKTIKASVSMSEKEFEFFTSLAKRFSEIHDGITIQTENVSPAEAYDKWKKAGQLGEAPDLMLLDNHWVQEFAALGFLQPVGEFFSSDQQNSRIATLMNQVKWNGYIWGVPKDVDPYILVWNKKTAVENKLDHAPETGDELLAWNKQLMKPDEGRYGIYMDPSDPYAFMAAASAVSSAWLENGKIWGDEAAAQKRLEAFLAPQDEAWTGKTYAKNFPQATTLWSPWEQLSKGQIAGMITTLSVFKSKVGNDLAMASIPNLTGDNQAVWLKGRSFSVSSRTPYAKLLMDWIKEMTTPEMEILFWNEAKVLPAQKPAYSLEPIHSDEHIKSFDWLISHGKVLPNASETAKNLSALQTELNKLWRGETTIKQIIETTGKNWTLEESKH